MKKIIGFVGTAQSGKSSACSLLEAEFLKRRGSISGYAVKTNGDVIKYPEIQIPHPYNPVIILNFATPLKELLIDWFGLTQNQVFGTDKDKNTLTNLRWDNITELVDITEHSQFDYFDECREFLTGRDAMEVIGTLVLRAIDPDIHCKKMIKNIKSLPCHCTNVLIGDVRQVNEVDTIHQMDGQVIKLTRGQAPKVSEQVDMVHFDIGIDNKNMTLEEKNKLIIEQAEEFGFFDTLEDKHEREVSSK